MANNFNMELMDCVDNFEEGDEVSDVGRPVTSEEDTTVHAER